MGSLSKLSLLVVPYLYLIFYHYKIEEELRRSILINAAMSVTGFFATVKMIPVTSRYVLRRNLFGYDINQKGTPQGTVNVPEPLGIVVGIVFLVVAILFQISNFIEDSVISGWLLTPVALPNFWGVTDSNWLVEYTAALVSICFMILLGFVDDVLDVPWRIKLVLPAIAALPLLMAYAGHTTIVIPKPLVQYVGMEVWNAGRTDVQSIYVALGHYLQKFHQYSIHAGINGLEVGQTVVISFAANLGTQHYATGASPDPEYKQTHAFSGYLVQPLIATSLGLLSYNWYPSAVFVGDTYTYFAGMTMAVVGILGHLSDTLMLFFLPQVLNFVLSLPQLCGYIPCPRHRLPRFDPHTGLVTRTNDGALIDVCLRMFSRMTEKSLCIFLLVFQHVVSVSY